jgi:GrpB-like predicted nucleotidyltransferase (UPF0157 family)
VPGLAAKPIVDIQVTVDDPDDDAAFVPQLARAGYVLHVIEPEHRMLRTPDRAVQIHVWQHGGAEARRVLLFRDRLRADEADRELYESVKRSLADQQWDSVQDYADAKSTVVAEILARAEQWAG